MRRFLPLFLVIVSIAALLTLASGPQAHAQSATFGDGTYVVGTDIAPGTYQSQGGDGCYWARLSGFDGTPDEVIYSVYPTNSSVVTIKPTDAGFESINCGTWALYGASAQVVPTAIPTPTPTVLPAPTQAATATDVCATIAAEERAALNANASAMGQALNANSSAYGPALGAAAGNAAASGAISAEMGSNAGVITTQGALNASAITQQYSTAARNAGC